MKKLLLVMMMVATSTLVGCGKKSEKRAPISQSDARGARGGGVDPTQTQSAGGYIFQYNDMSSSEFLSGVKDFLSPMVPAEFVGEVNGNYNTNANTGVTFSGKVRLQSGNFSPNSTRPYTNVNSSSTVLVVVYDEFVGQKDSEGNVIPAIPVNLANAQGYVEGNNVEIRFSDSYGSIVVQGQLSGSTLNADIAYENAGQAKRYLGWVSMNACSFFVCN